MSYFCLRRMLLLFALGVSITRAIAQTSATVTLEKAVINAGENIKATVALDTPSPCRAQVDVYLVLQGASPNTGLSQGRSYFVVSGIAAKGDTKVSISSTTPFDNPGGEFAPKPSPLSSGLICDGYSMPHNFAIPNDLHLTVVPVPDTNTYPTQANVVLNVSQKQFLETKAHNLDKLYGRFSD
jgi:hypothetical protein